MQNDEITHFVRTVLAKRFHDNAEKQKINDNNDRKLNFACPICGDSEKKSSKKRGNLYFDTGAYKCWNDGCMAYMSIAEFVAKLSREHGIMLPSFILESEYKPVKIKRGGSPLLRFMTSDTSELITITDVLNRFSLKRLDDIDESCAALDYIRGRNLDQIDDFGDCLYCDSSDNKVFIFNFDRRSGKLLGFSMRFLDKNAERKYIIKSYSDLANIFSQINLDKDLIEDANFLNNYFNILNVDFSKPILMTEGQFDSLLLENCIATTGVSKAKSIMPSLGAKAGLRILFDRDKAGKDEMIPLIKQGYSVFLWNKIIDDIKPMYSGSSELIKMTEIKDINDLYSFIRIKKPRYTVKEFNEFIRSYFSDSIYDLVYL
jgi:hypothetical protein